jgi:hypothetical protein
MAGDPVIGELNDHEKIDVSSGSSEGNELSAEEKTQKQQKMLKTINDSAISNKVDLSLAVADRTEKSIQAVSGTQEDIDTLKEQQTRAEAAIEEAINNESIVIKEDEVPTVSVFERLYVKTEPISYSAVDNTSDSDSAVTKGYTVKITPYVQTIASTASKASDVVLEPDDANAVNAVVLEDTDGNTEKEIKITVPTEVTIAVPAFADDSSNALIKETNTDAVWIKHVHEDGGNKTTYYYKPSEVKKDGNNYNVTFDNPNGFSEFTVLVKDNDSEDEVYVNGAQSSIENVSVGMAAPGAPTGKVFSGWQVVIAGTTYTFGSITNDVYNTIIEAYLAGKSISVSADYANAPSRNTSGSTTDSQTDVTDTTDAAQPADAPQNTDAANNTGNAAQNSTNGTSQNRKVTIVDPDVAEEEEQAPQLEESVVKEEVAEVEGGDLTADEADGGVIVETVGNSSSAWIWLLVVLACAAAAILLIVVFKRRKDENA